MNASLSDGNEPVIDIFILSANSRLSAELEKQFRDEGYYVTLFSDGTHLLETLRNGKPNLLMCDTTSADADAFEVCRQIKADDYLWNIPVLIITGASDLGDLLRVLDCNADNFIAHPFDPPYLLSLIEGMLTVPVERQTPEQIKTQFKIKHDEQVFVVTADRRKLLEFLLSSFEIAVNKSADLSRAQEDIQNLTLTTRKMDETVQENTKVIGIINETLKTKENKLAELTRQLADREQTVREKIADIDQLSRDLSAEKSAHAQARNEIQRTLQEKDESLAAHQTTIDQLQRQVSDQSSELATLRPALEHAQAELSRESGRLKETENELSMTSASKEQAEKAFSALTSEYEQLKINVGTEKNRAQEAEDELKAVLQAKNQSEQDLTGIINDLKGTAKQQAGEINRLREESEYVHTRLSLTEENLRAVTAAKEQSEASLREVIGSGQKNILQLQEQLDTAGKALQEREQGIQALNAELASSGAARQSVEQELASTSRALAETKTALEALNAELASAGAARQSVEQELASSSRVLAETKTALEAETQNNASAKEDLARVYAEKEKAEALAESLSASLKESQERSRENEERMNAVLQKRDQDLGELRQVHEDAKTALSSHATTVVQMKRDLESAVSARRGLEEKLDQVKTNHENETLRRQEAEDQLRDALSQQQHLEQDLEREVEETKSLHADFTEERRMHEEAKKQVQSLEAQVSALNREKHEAEQAAADLTAEIDQARVALADEWGDHMTDNERLAAVAQKKPQPAPVPSSMMKREAEIIKKRAVIVKVPDMPSDIRPLPRSMVAVDPVKASESETPHIKSVEDLYEDDEDDGKKSFGAPVVSIVHEPATEPVRDVLPDLIPDSSDEEGSFFEDDAPLAPDSRNPPDDDTDDGESASDAGTGASATGQNAAFNRAQWLDLLKWSHHCEGLTQDQRMQIVRMGRLIQKGRRLTKKQEEQVLEMIALVQRLGYRIP